MEKKRRRLAIISILSLFICMALLLIIHSINTINPDTADPQVALKDEPNINLDSELKKIEILIKMGFENADIYYNRGWIYDQKGRIDLARRDYTSAVQLDENYADAFFNRGLIYMKENKYAEAISDFTEAIRSDPLMSDALCNRANAYRALGRFSDADMDLKKAMEFGL